jgi:very-short-patch-repair endonuclease
MTKAEIKLWSALRRKQIQYKFRRQFGIGPYIADFYCPQFKFIIEVDGDVHYIGDAQQRDKLRTKFLYSKGIIVKRFTNSEVFHDLPMVLENIWYVCNQLVEKKLASLVNLPIKGEIIEGGCYDLPRTPPF